MSRIDELKALAAVRRAYESFTVDTDRSVSLYLTDHMDSLPLAVLQKLTGWEAPEADDLLDALVAVGSRLDRKSGNTVTDFTLRGGVTKDILRAHIHRDGTVDHIEMVS